MAEEQADVAAETAGRVVATPVERGTPVAAGRRADPHLSPTETDAQLQGSRGQRRADRGAARASRAAAPFDVNAVPEVQNAKAASELAQSEFNRIKSLLDQRVVSQSEFDQRRTQMEAARQQYEAAKNGAAQQYQSLQAARARVALARKALADTVGPRAVRRRRRRAARLGRRLRDQGHEGRGRRARQSAARAADGSRAVRLGGGAPASRSRSRSTPIPGRQFEGTVRYVSPALAGRSARADGRSGRAEPERRAEAGPVRDRAHRAAGRRRRACWCRPPPCRPPPAPAACTSSTATTSKNASSRSAQTVGDRDRNHQRPQGRRTRRDDRTSRSSPTASKVVADHQSGASCSG